LSHAYNFLDLANGTVLPDHKRFLVGTVGIMNGSGSAPAVLAGREERTAPVTDHVTAVQRAAADLQFSLLRLTPTGQSGLAAPQHTSCAGRATHRRPGDSARTEMGPDSALADQEQAEMCLDPELVVLSGKDR
jgi:hypothetical protein